MGEFIVVLLECIFEAFIFLFEPRTLKGTLTLILTLMLTLILICFILSYC